MLKGKKGHRSHKRTKHSGMGGCGTPTSSENTSPCILKERQNYDSKYLFSNKRGMLNGSHELIP